jgi:hypothetical protein
MTPSPAPDFRPALAALSGALATLDRFDITELVVRHHAGMDFRRIRTTLAQFFEVLEVPERLADFDRLVAEALAQI